MHHHAHQIRICFFFFCSAGNQTQSVAHARQCSITELHSQPLYPLRVGTESCSYNCWVVRLFNSINFCFMLFGTLLLCIYITYIITISSFFLIWGLTL
jgi:hypothetical protein